jgi:hypothetical protein
MLDHTIVISAHLKQWMVDHGCDPDRVQVIYIGTDTNKFKPDPVVRLSPSPSPGPFACVSIGTKSTAEESEASQQAAGEG